MEEKRVIRTPFLASLLAGAAAGLSVDVTLFPLDTVKTRLQSAEGFFKSGGFKGIYSGIGSVLAGSMPGAALFFCTYETVKATLTPYIDKSKISVVHMTAASCGEVVACLVRVPTEVVKQRAQANINLSSISVFTATLRKEGFRGFYRGYFSTVIREVPFSFIQFPLWEFLKAKWRGNDEELAAWKSGVCGAISGAFAAGVTTPLDVAKTRIMLANAGSPLAQGSIWYAMTVVWQERGVQGLFAGVTPRVMWITIGGAIFLGVYDKARMFCVNEMEKKSN